MHSKAKFINIHIQKTSPPKKKDCSVVKCNFSNRPCDVLPPLVGVDPLHWCPPAAARWPGIWNQLFKHLQQISDPNLWWFTLVGKQKNTFNKSRYSVNWFNWSMKNMFKIWSMIMFIIWLNLTDTWLLWTMTQLYFDIDTEKFFILMLWHGKKHKKKTPSLCHPRPTTPRRTALSRTNCAAAGCAANCPRGPPVLSRMYSWGPARFRKIMVVLKNHMVRSCKL